MNEAPSLAVSRRRATCDQQSGWLPIWMIFPLLLSVDDGRSALVWVAAGLLMGLASWTVGWGAASTAAESLFLVGWSAGWLATLAAFLASQDASVAVETGILVGGLLFGAAGVRFAWWYRSRQPLSPSRTRSNTPWIGLVSIVAIVGIGVSVLDQPAALNTNLLAVLGFYLLLTLVFAVRGRGVTPKEC